MAASLKEQVYVGISDVVVMHNPSVLYTVVGSCIAVCIHDPLKHIGGMAHIMLPKISLFKNKEPQAKFADIAIPQLIAEMESKGCIRNRMLAKITGGANVLRNLVGGEESIGMKNLKATIQALATEGVKIGKKDVLGNQARSVRFDIESGLVEINFAQAGQRTPHRL